MHPYQQHAAPYPAQQRPGAAAANAMMSALANPYQATPYAAAHSSRYAQAYYQSTHYAQAYANYGNTAPSGPSGYNGNPYAAQSSSQAGAAPQVSNIFLPPPNSAGWYAPGTCRCTYPNCNFIGAAKSLEVHRMDRHLIYPPGWKERKRKPDWDADPSLIGKRVPIQGTNLVLDSPEALAQWIAERKKRWPTATRTEDKAQKREEARARGQLDLDDPSFGGARKRRRVEDASNAGDAGRGRGRGRGQPRGRGAGRGRGASARGRGGAAPPTAHLAAPVTFEAGLASLPAKPAADVVEAAAQGHAAQTEDHASGSGSESDSDGEDAPPEVATSKPALGLTGYESGTDEERQSPVETHIASIKAPVPPPSAPTEPITTAKAVTPAQPARLKPVKQQRPPQPKQPPPNPFAPKQSLLRSLLLPEIRMTVSNLSQAIRFLVDNDFLENVELNPGDASEKMIEVIGESAGPLQAPKDGVSVGISARDSST